MFDPLPMTVRWDCPVLPNHGKICRFSGMIDAAFELDSWWHRGYYIPISVLIAKVPVVAVYKTSDLKKGLKVQIDGEPYLLIEVDFFKPGKGNALYRCKMKNLIRPSILDRTLKGGDELEAADVEDVDTTFLYKQGETYVFMDSESFEQYELTSDQVDENWKYLTENLPCSMLLFNGNPIAMTPPSHVQMEVLETEPGTKGDTATSVTKPAKVSTGAEFAVPGFIKVGNVIKIDTRTGDYIERVSI